MGNSRNFRPGRSTRRRSQKDLIRSQGRELAYMKGLNLGLEAQLAATKMERPADLEDWINDVALGDMDPEEREQWDAMSDPEREHFMDELGQKINTVAAIGVDDGGSSNPSGDGTGS